MTMLHQLMAAAAAHGHASEPDHEVGDLQTVLHSCWRRLTTEQQREVFEEHQEMVAQWLEGR